MVSQKLNFLWINLDIPAPADPGEGLIHQPMPTEYIENIREAAKRHSNADMALWVDSKRLTPAQLDYLHDQVEKDLSNLKVQDLRTIPRYDQEELYNQAETDPNWRSGGQKSTIWRQVDCAKVLVSLQDDYDQTFFADMDHAHIDIDSDSVQNIINEHGLMIGAASPIGGSWSGSQIVEVENQLWGFNREGRQFFDTYYQRALEAAYIGMNGYYDFKQCLDHEINRKNIESENKFIAVSDICLKIDNQGQHAEHPGHSLRNGNGNVQAPQLIAYFNDNGATVTNDKPSFSTHFVHHLKR